MEQKNGKLANVVATPNFLNRLRNNLVENSNYPFLQNARRYAFFA